MLAAADLASDHHLAVILSAAAEAGCRLPLSEDSQEGFTVFLSAKHELLAALLVLNPFNCRMRPPKKSRYPVHLLQL
jgi:predicted nucleic acid-binding protein